MDPSHARKHTPREIEVKAAEVLRPAYPIEISIPVDIDRLAESHPMVDEIAPIASLENQFNVAAVLYRKPNGHVAIIVDENTFDYQPTRASFSIAHEFGHVVLHRKLWDGCNTLSQSVELHERIKSIYWRVIERDANRFASAILMPSSTMHELVPRLYTVLVEEYGYEPSFILPKLCTQLAREYTVSAQALQIRLDELSLNNKIETALSFRSPYLDI